MFKLHSFSSLPSLSCLFPSMQNPLVHIFFCSLITTVLIIFLPSWSSIPNHPIFLLYIVHHHPLRSLKPRRFYLISLHLLTQMIMGAQNQKKLFGEEQTVVRLDGRIVLGGQSTREIWKIERRREGEIEIVYSLNWASKHTFFEMKPLESWTSWKTRGSDHLLFLVSSFEKSSPF